jgi:hypothetical protein
MRVESGPAKTDRNWQFVRFILFAGLALWFCYDGAVRWPKKNREAAENALQVRPWEGKLRYDDLPGRPRSLGDFQTLITSAQASRSGLHAALGRPQVGEGTSEEYFVSKYGYARATYSGEKPSLETWKNWEGGHTGDEIQAQFYWALLPLPFALYFLWKLYRAATLRVTVDDEGLLYAGRRIPFAEMNSLRDYSPKGWIDLYYGANGRERKLRLDNEKIALFDEVVAAICQAKGFRNEVKAHQDAERREEAEGDVEAEASEPSDEERSG